MTNESKRTVTLIPPKIEIEQPWLEATFKYWRIENGGGQDTVQLGKGRTVVLKGAFDLKARREPKKGDIASGVLLIKVAQPGTLDLPPSFSATYDRDLWRP